MAAIEAFAVVFALALALPAAVYAGESVSAWLAPSAQRAPAVPAASPRTSVLIPAHDEAAGIGEVLDALVPQLEPGDRVLVVADNCTDGTAEIARAHGVDVSERVDPDRRGKGFAIAHGLEVLASEPPDVVVLLDADCRVGGAGLGALARTSASLDRPVQAQYLLLAPADAGTITRLSAFALVVRNRVRPLGLWALGLPSQLQGSGMAFPWDQLRGLPALDDDLVEDLALGLLLAEQGHAPRFLPTVEVESALPTSLEAAGTQRTRWEQGQLLTLLRRCPSLAIRGLIRRDPELVALALDLSTPPLALLVALQLAVTAVLAAGIAVGLSVLPAAIALTSVTAIGVSTLGSWWIFGRETVPFTTLATAPLYVLWKLPIYLGLVTGRRERRWVRTARPDDESTRAEGR